MLCRNTALGIFPSGQHRTAERFALETGLLDLCLLEVDATGLAEGRDYVTLRDDTSLRLQPGDRVVAVGSPFGLTGTQTFGHVSALRSTPEGRGLELIQTDAAVNHGNSGGPLLLARGERFTWVGVNTFGLMPGDGSAGLNFSIRARHVDERNFEWRKADKWGAAEVIRTSYRRDTTVQ